MGNLGSIDHCNCGAIERGLGSPAREVRVSETIVETHGAFYCERVTRSEPGCSRVTKRETIWPEVV